MMYADIIDAEDVYEALKELGIKVSCDADMTAAQKAVCGQLDRLAHVYAGSGGKSAGSGG